MAIELARIAQHNLVLVTFRLGQLSTMLTALQGRHDQRERCAQLVADIGEKLAFELIQLQRLLVESSNFFIGRLSDCQCHISALLGLSQTLEKVGKKRAHENKYDDGKCRGRIGQREGEGGRDKVIPYQQRADNRRGQSAFNSACPCAEEGGREK